ncbi:MAG: hypothetical protein IKB16_01335 [Lentisphaeria bacterium]|nr:hypothetical protein [Lentisphaeria bacterium]
MKKEAAETTVKTKKVTRKRPAKKALKPVAKRVVKIMTVDDNLKKLAASRVPSKFVKEHEGTWDHAGWLQFLDILKTKGYDPIDPDRAGLILEDAKAKYLAKKS